MNIQTRSYNFSPRSIAAPRFDALPPRFLILTIHLIRTFQSIRRGKKKKKKKNAGVKRSRNLKQLKFDSHPSRGVIKSFGEKPAGLGPFTKNESTEFSAGTDSPRAFPAKLVKSLWFGRHSWQDGVSEPHTMDPLLPSSAIFPWKQRRGAGFDRVHGPPAPLPGPRFPSVSFSRFPSCIRHCCGFSRAFIYLHTLFPDAWTDRPTRWNHSALKGKNGQKRERINFGDRKNTERNRLNEQLCTRVKKMISNTSFVIDSFDGATRDTRLSLWITVRTKHGELISRVIEIIILFFFARKNDKHPIKSRIYSSPHHLHSLIIITLMKITRC